MSLTAEERFKVIVDQLIDNGIYPGPTAINRALEQYAFVKRGGRTNHLNGRETKWRREVMYQRGIPLQRPWLVNDNSL